MKFRFIGLSIFLILFLFLSGCKKNKEDDTVTTSSYYIGEAKLSQSGNIVVPPITFANSSLSLTTNNKKDIEVSLTVDKTIIYKGKILTRFDGIFSVYVSPIEEIRIDLTPLPNNVMLFNYSKTEKSTNNTISYRFLGTKQ